MNVSENVSGNHKNEVYEVFVAGIVESFRKFGCLINLPLNFMDSLKM